MNDSRIVPLHCWLTRAMPTDVAQSIQRLRDSEDVVHVAVMPDVHLANEVCVGVALATRGRIYPAAVGSDIGCGMAAIALDADATLLDDDRSAARLLAGLYRVIPSLKHARETLPAALPADLASVALSDSSLERIKHRDGLYQLGTLGRGNHFVEFQADTQRQLWLMIHSGSRGMGQAITSHHVKRAKLHQPRSALIGWDAESDPGRAYLSDLNWAIRYAEHNRLALIAEISKLVGELFGVRTQSESLIHANHNHVRRETHFGKEVWVHRKGALPASAGEWGVIPGSMGSASFHVVGRGAPESLCSSSHGAGREFSRSEALKRINVRRFQREMHGVWFDQRRASLLRDEAPSAYKDIQSVMRAQRELTKIERELRPLLSYKGA